MEVALLTRVVFEAAAGGDPRITEIIENGAQALCDYTETIASRLHLLAPKVMLMGGLFYRDSIYTHAFRRRLKKNLPDARVAIAERAPELGAAWLAAEVRDHVTFQPKLSEEQIDNLAAALTEQRNPRSENLEKLSARRVKDGDIVIGITASGRTPFVLGALAWAKSAGVTTMLLTCNPHASAVNVDVAVDLAVGPEILTGSTRLKAGTATKVALNIISTGAMVMLGKVRGNLMIDLRTTSAKLQDRATRVVAELAQCDYDSARQQLEAADWNLREVVGKIDG